MYNKIPIDKIEQYTELAELHKKDKILKYFIHFLLLIFLNIHCKFVSCIFIISLKLLFSNIFIFNLNEKLNNNYKLFFFIFYSETIFFDEPP